jgi:hypothetical protein
MVELAALEQARFRLEAALASDENWRALQQSSADDEAAEDSAARSARDTRLEMALADNPVYQAWRHLNEAIDALRAASADASEPVSTLVRPVHADADAPELADLPEDIANLLREGAPGDTEDRDGDLAAEAEPERAAAEVHDRAETDEPAETDELAETDEPAKMDEPAIAPVSAELADEVPSQPSSSAARHAEDHPEPADQAGPMGRPVVGMSRGALDRKEEATVTFVRREPRAPLLPSAQLPADLGTERKSELFERLRGLSDDPEPPEEPISPAEGSAEEAEVVIVSTEIARERQEAEARAGRVRKFRKALFGD